MFCENYGTGEEHFLVHGHDFGLEIWPFVGRRVSIFDCLFFYYYHYFWAFVDTNLRIIWRPCLRRRPRQTDIACKHDDVIKWRHFPRYWPFVRGIHRSPVNSPHKGQWRGALMFTLICARINGWENNREAGDLRRYRTHYDVIVMRNIRGKGIAETGRFARELPQTALVRVSTKLFSLSFLISCEITPRWIYYW